MVKGCQRRTIHIKDMQSRFFEEAYFILKPGVSDSSCSGEDMIEEAVKIASNSIVSLSGKKRGRIHRPSLVSFVAGVALGCFICAFIIILL